MSAPEEDRAQETAPRDEVHKTREMKLPPVPAAPQQPVLADQPTDEHPPPDPRQLTRSWGEWQPLQPRVVPRERSRAPYVLAALVLVVLVAGIVVALVFRR